MADPTSGGPFFDDLEVGYTVESAPSMTLTAGHAALHQAILGDRLTTALDARLTAAVLGVEGVAAHPALVWDVAIGQSTLVTRRVRANLFYRGLVLRRWPLIGDTLTTQTEVVAMRQNGVREGRPATGMAVLRIQTVDQEERSVLDFWRCAMLPLRDPRGVTSHADDFSSLPEELDAEIVHAAVADWDLAAFKAAVGGPGIEGLAAGRRWKIEGGDVVSCAPELARLSLNIAAAHHDVRAGGGRRLVYGGHTIGLAAAQASRVLPDLVSIVAWHGCDHLAPVLEGDTLHSELELERVEPLAGGGGLLHLRSRVDAWRDGTATPVLDWRFVAVMA